MKRLACLFVIFVLAAPCFAEDADEMCAKVAAMKWENMDLVSKKSTLEMIETMDTAMKTVFKNLTAYAKDQKLSFEEAVAKHRAEFPDSKKNEKIVADKVCEFRLCFDCSKDDSDPDVKKAIEGLDDSLKKLLPLFKGLTESKSVKSVIELLEKKK